MAGEFPIDKLVVTTSQVGPSVDANGLSPTLTLRKAFAAGAGGAPDDVAIYSGNAPYGFRILDVQVLISTLVALSTVQLRSATGGGGSALSDAFASVAVGRLRDLGVGIGNVTPTVATNGTLVIRRSDSGVAGEVILRLQKT
jgi:hypothetical protein